MRELRLHSDQCDDATVHHAARACGGRCDADVTRRRVCISSRNWQGGHYSIFRGIFLFSGRDPLSVRTALPATLLLLVLSQLGVNPSGSRVVNVLGLSGTRYSTSLLLLPSPLSGRIPTRPAIALVRSFIQIHFLQSFDILTDAGGSSWRALR